MLSPMQLAVGRGDNGEAIATDTRHRRLDDGQHAGGGDRRIDRIATLAQTIDRRRGGKWMRCRRQGIAGQNRRTAGELQIAHIRPRTGGPAIGRLLRDQGAILLSTASERRAERSETRKPATTSISEISIRRKNTACEHLATVMNKTR